MSRLGDAGRATQTPIYWKAAVWYGMVLMQKYLVIQPVSFFKLCVGKGQQICTFTSVCNRTLF